MIIKPGEFDYRFRAGRVLLVSEPDDTINYPGAVHVADMREFRTGKGADEYAKRLREEGHGWTTIEQTGKLVWYTSQELADEVERLGQRPKLTEQQARKLREAVVEPVRAIVKVLIEKGMEPEAALKAVRWATYTLTSEAEEM